MFKIWVKIMSDEKMVNSFVYENDDIFHINRLGIYLADICNELDIETFTCLI